ncbi:putative potassium transport system protein kup [Azospirillaceae bacterium]
MHTPSSRASIGHSGKKPRSLGLAISAIGIVYGDIGTSPLYTMRECFNGAYVMEPIPENILGILSLIFWSMAVVITLKYVTFIMKADNKGEGGILALQALMLHTLGSGGSAGKRRDSMISNFLLGLGLFGAALFYGDSMITPAISVLSAIEGMDVATPLFRPYVVPITLAVLACLFAFQRHGTGRVGALFGPIMCAWFISLGILGFRWITLAPEVLIALNPYYVFQFFATHQIPGILVLGGVVLALTGAEALYADMGHFGCKSIRVAWFLIVMPCLLLNYFGQGALLLINPAAVENPFFRLVPTWGVFPMVIMSTAATVIASQAVISGAFSLTRQAIQLGYWPRMKIQHTSSDEIGQIYIPSINWFLLLAIIALVLIFQSSSNLAAAYGVAVTGTMVITTILFYVVARHAWGWSRWMARPIVGVFLLIDLSFFASNAMKIMEGGWLPLAVALLAFILMTTWKSGRALLEQLLSETDLPLEYFLKRAMIKPPTRVAGTAIFMTSDQNGVPQPLLHNMKHNKILHQRVIFLTVQTEDVPYVAEGKRFEIIPLEQNFFRVLLRYGFIEDPNIPKDLENCRKAGLEFDMMDTSFFIGRETMVLSTEQKLPFWKRLAFPWKMPTWQKSVFIWMARNAVSITEFFKIPANRVVELGTQLEL